VNNSPRSEPGAPRGASPDSTEQRGPLAELNARHTGQSVERIEADSERDRWFTAAEARGYGLVDHVVNRIGQVAAGPPAG
jgi:ATP-dependent protease ClpP protease subunit